MENFIIENENQQERNTVEKNVFHNKPRRYENSHIHKTNHREKKSGKYCDVHNTTTHSNDECRKQQKDKKTNSKKTLSKNYLMNEPRPPVKIVKIPISINGKNMCGIIDTGSDKNFITAKIADENNLNLKTMDNEEKVQMADGRCITIKRSGWSEF
ncbi:hypothetical protein DMUE_0865 [Dictyocoela muelleri]|nr:hypothetical protein DMUE_0865 [Dictyocoela muelleri]